MAGSSFVGDTAEGTNAFTIPWLRRMSTIAQSHDGSSLSSRRPSSPSLFSNGSNAAFFPSVQVVTPRNRLVKRSISHRVLQSPSDNAPILPSQTPTLRRPATSHQRSEQLRLQTAQRELEPVNPLPIPEPRKLSNVELGTAKTREIADGACTPYFESSVVRVLRDTTLRGASLPRSNSHFDSIRRVLPRLGTPPQLVKASALRKAYTQDQPAPSLTPPRLSQDRRPHSPPPTAGQIPAQHKGPRARHSFSFGEVMTTPTPSSWKIRRATSVKKRSLAEGLSGRRAVSAPQKKLGEASHPNTILRRPDESRANHVPLDHEYSASSFAKAKQRSIRTSSSPLPPLDRISAFEIDIPGVSQPESPHHRHRRRGSSPFPPSPDSPSDLQRPSSLRIKPHRTSRIPSDRASTVFSSDNEHSRVFSADGDDFDCRSETVYDSIRTDATSSSHSGAKGLHAETFFQQPIPPEWAQRGMPALQENLASSIGSPARYNRSSLEEEEAARTPVQANSINLMNTASSSQRSFPLTSDSENLAATSTALGSEANALPIQSDYFWSIEEEDSNWGDSESIDTDAAPRRVPSDFSAADYGQSRLPSLGQDVTPSDDAQRGTYSNYYSLDRGGRMVGRRSVISQHARSQSVPLPPDRSSPHYNNASRLGAWMLGGKGVSEDWDGDFEFDEPGESVERSRDDAAKDDPESDQGGVFVPPSILERQASVHGQFGQVKELTQLVEKLRDLHHKGREMGLVQGVSSGMWQDAEGIIELATVDNAETLHPFPHSPNSSTFDFEAFDEDASVSNRTIRDTTPSQDDFNSVSGSSAAAGGSPFTHQTSTPTRSRQDSIAKVKHVLEHINHQRSPQESLPDNISKAPRKVPFDTTSLRDLVTRATMVVRHLENLIRLATDPSQASPTNSDRRPKTPPDPLFSQIFQNSPTPSSSTRKSPRVHRRQSSNSFLKDSPSPTGSDRNGHMQIMSVV